MFKSIRQLGLVLLISFILINFANISFAQFDSGSFKSCQTAERAKKENTAVCDPFKEIDKQCNDKLKAEGEKYCNDNATTAEIICNNNYTKDATKCNETYDKKMEPCNSAAAIAGLFQDDCIEEVKRIDGPIKDACIKKSEDEKKTCDEQANADKKTCLNEYNTYKCESEYDKCIAQVYAAIDEKCYEDTAATKPPTIPKISTLPGPEASNVSEVNPYLTGNFLPRVARTIIGFTIGAAVLGLILGAVTLLTAYGNEEKYTTGKKAIYFSLIGLVLALLSFAIVQLIFFTGFQAGQIK